MNIFTTRIRNTLLGSALGLFVAMPVLADDSEIYVTQQEASAATPNVLFIFDTSGSMDTEETTVPIYKAEITYGGSCQADRVYFATNGQPPSDCSTAAWFPVSSNTCATLNNLDQKQGFTTKDLAATQLHGSDWEDLVSSDSGNVRCNGVGTKYFFYSGNYLNYWNYGRAPVQMTRTAIVREVATSIANTLEGVKLGLMRYDSNAHGGMVLHPVEDIDTSRNSIITTLSGFTDRSGAGNTPLSETLYEAALYMKGAGVHFGNSSRPVYSVASSRTAANENVYKSPIEYKCQKNYIVYLTDGEPTSDNEANSDIQTMIGKTCALPDSPVEGGGTGRCTDELAEYLHTQDLSPLPDTQTVSTYMIGFGSSVQRSLAYLDAIAAKGGTNKAYTGTDIPSLTNALQEIFTAASDRSQTFVTPSISVNAFNRARTENDLFFSLFQAADAARWAGNLKKYTLSGTQIKDWDGANAVDSTTGFFAQRTRSIWSTEPDGPVVTEGGAAKLLPNPADRKIYTYLGSKDLSRDVNNIFDVSNTSALTDAVLAIGPTDPSRETVINWTRGYTNGDKDRPPMYTMGDPMHGQPGVVVYGEVTSGGKTEMDSVVFVPTNDGFLHAITGITTGGGQELWAFIPPELLKRLKTLVADRPIAERTYGLDGDVQVLKFDANQNGIVDVGTDKVWIFFGMRSGGNRYYALDVTDRNKPELLWDIGPSDLPGVGETWSPPTVARVNVTDKTQNHEKFVFIFGGGYDRGQENQAYSTDSVGKRIFMVDAESGSLLWYAGDTLAANLPLINISDPGKTMNNSIPGRITVLDTNGDQFADRMYAGDMGGRIWRFDIANGNTSGSLVTGGVIAKLGAAGTGASATTAARRFYNAPDVALISRRGQDPYYNISIGSGYRGHPLDTVTDERFYAVRDRQPFSQLDQSTYNNYTAILDGDLVDITTNPTGTTISATAAGWKLRFNGLSHSGEKVLAEATTVSGVVLFPSFDPGPPGAALGPCYPTNTNRAYAISIDSGRPALDFNDTGAIDNDDLSTSLAQQGIVGQINVAVLNELAGDDNGNGNNNGGASTICIAGVEVLKKCVGVGGTVRTFWRRNSGQ